MEYVIFGAGHRGEIIAHILGDTRVIAFIDSKSEKIGTTFCGKKVISYLEYKEKYRQNVIVVSPVMGDDIEELLQRDCICYFALDECPVEFMGYGLKKVEEKGIKYPQKIGDKIILYGCTLYSVLVYEYLKKKGVLDIRMVPHEYMDKERVELFSQCYPEIQLQNLEETKDQTGEVWIAVYDHRMNERTMVSGYKDIFNWSKHIEYYKNPEIEKFKNKHKGKRCFIIATGPSLTFEDLEVLKNNKEICISMNTIVDVLPLTKWRPTYYAVLDAIGLELWEEKIKAVDCEASFIADSSINFDYETLPDNAHIYHVLTGKEIYRGKYFSEQCSDFIYNKGTITYVCMQLAVYMGFEKIYLLGVDFNYKSQMGNYLKNDNETIQSEQYIKISDYYVERAYKIAREYADSHGIKIYNATRGGKLEVFERVNFDTLFI